MENQNKENMIVAEQSKPFSTMTGNTNTEAPFPNASGSLNPVQPLTNTGLGFQMLIAKTETANTEPAFDPLNPLPKSHISSINFADKLPEKIALYAEQIRQIQEDFAVKNLRFEDKVFPAINTSLFKSPEKLEESFREHKTWSWMRPEEIYKKEPVFESLSVSHLKEIRPGPLSNRKFTNVLAIAILTGLIDNLVVDIEHLRMGYASFQFFKNGEWVYVIVDTYLPYSKEGKKFLFSHSSGTASLIVGLLEKAYAKLNGCYEFLRLLDWRDMASEIGCLHTEKIKVDEETKDPGYLKRLFGQLVSIFAKKEKYAIFCLKKRAFEANQKLFDGGNNLGIKENALLLLQSVEDFSNKELRFTRLKNIWGLEFNWIGPFANNSDDWEKQKDVRDALFGHKLSSSDFNSCFYMKIESFVKEFTHIYIVRYLTADTQAFSLQGAWQGATMAGLPSDLLQKYPVSFRKSEKFTKTDSDECWFNNPQYRIKVSQPTRLIVDLSQLDTTASGRGNDYKLIGFYLMKTSGARQRIWEFPSPDKIVSFVLNKNRETEQKAEGRITKTGSQIKLESFKPSNSVNREGVVLGESETTDLKVIGRSFQEIKPAHQKSAIQQFLLEPEPNQLYGFFNLLVVVQPDKAAKKPAESIPFNLKLFANKKIEVEVYPQNYEKVVEDVWDESTAGGPYYFPSKKLKENPAWCLNQQYLLTFESPTHLKIVLQKAPKSQKKLKDAKLGIALCFLKGGFEVEPVSLEPFKKDKKHVNVKEELLSKLVYKTKEKLAVKKIRNPQRKIKLLKGENYIESSFGSSETACLFLRVLPVESPLLVVPCLDKSGLQGEFRLTIFSSSEVGLIQLDRKFNPIALGEWTQYNSGGSHIYSEKTYSNAEKRTWQTNAAYLVRFSDILNEGRSVKVRLNLSFAESNWQRKMIGQLQHSNEVKKRSKKNSVNVDCMICLYVLKPASKLSIDLIVFQSPFSPTSSLDFEFEFRPELFEGQSSFVVVPATFEV